MTDSDVIFRVGRPPQRPPRKRGPWSFLWPLTGSIVLALIASVALLLTLRSPAADEDRSMEAAQRAAQAHMDAYVAEDWAGAWDLWSALAKATMSRDDYARLRKECGKITGVLPFTIKSIRPEGPDGAVFIAERAGVLFNYTMVFEKGAWRFQPSDDVLAGYALGVDALIAREKAAGNCFDR